jgi:hypothetical protein
MDENPLTTNVLEPFGLVMRYAQCYYCKSPDYNDRMIGERFGIRHCPDHEAWARRDCNAYLHSTHTVLLHDGFKNPVLQPFLENLLKTPIHVLRSSGIREDGWILNKSHYSFIDFKYIQKSKQDDLWCIPMIHKVSNLYKHVPIESLLCEENNSHITQEQITSVLATLDAGLYKNDFLQQQAVKDLSSDSNEVEETTNIQNVFVEGHGKCRVHIYPNDQDIQSVVLVQNVSNHSNENLDQRL